jgi:hypothetical protein
MSGYADKEYKKERNRVYVPAGVSGLSGISTPNFIFTLLPQLVGERAMQQRNGCSKIMFGMFWLNIFY